MCYASSDTTIRYARSNTVCAMAVFYDRLQELLVYPHRDTIKNEKTTPTYSKWREESNLIAYVIPTCMICYIDMLSLPGSCIWTQTISFRLGQLSTADQEIKLVLVNKRYLNYSGATHTIARSQRGYLQTGPQITSLSDALIASVTGECQFGGCMICHRLVLLTAMHNIKAWCNNWDMLQCKWEINSRNR